MDHALMQCKVRKVKGDDDSLVFVASSDRVDRMGDIIAQNWELADFKKAGSPFLYAHNYSLLPVGKVVKVWTEKLKASSKVGEAAVRTLARVKFVPESLLPFAQLVKEYYQAGWLKAVSVGFRPKKIKNLTDEERNALGLGRWGYYFERSELLELSAVSVPANPDAVIQGRSIPQDVEQVKQDVRGRSNWGQVMKWLDEVKTAFDSEDADESNLGRQVEIIGCVSGMNDGDDHGEPTHGMVKDDAASDIHLKTLFSSPEFIAGVRAALRQDRAATNSLLVPGKVGRFKTGLGHEELRQRQRRRRQLGLTNRELEALYENLGTLTSKGANR